MQLCLVSLLCLGASAAMLRSNNSSSQITGIERHSALPTFVGWYDAYSTGLGIWKWQNSLEAYQAHFGRFAGSKVSLLEIGVQSGGSIAMYKAALGAQLHYYGMDINPKCTSFEDPQATISILDQGQAGHWTHFWSSVVPSVDVLIDDGGHQSFQMLTTVQSALPHINPGGVYLCEDIHATNEDYLSGFLHPTADFLAANPTQVASVDIYPFMIVVQKPGGTYTAPAPGAAALTVDTLEKMLVALPEHKGKTVRLMNPAWPTLMTAESLKGFFTSFYGLHLGTVSPKPDGCFSDAVAFPECTMHVANTDLQSLVAAVHIYPTFADVIVAAAPPSIYATRRGNVWIPYKG